MTLGCHADGACPVAPHPNLLARLKAEKASVKGTAAEASFRKKQHVLGQGPRTGPIVGLNDGLIFPRSHFDKKTSLSTMRRAALDRAPLRGVINVVLVLVEFTDVKMAPDAKQRFEKLFFSKGEIETTRVIMWLIVQIDVFCVVHAGTGAEVSGDANDIWSVKWQIPQERNLDNVKVFGFLTIPDDAKIGVSAHEIGHLLFGWPDLYDTDGSSKGIGGWCLMSYGSWGGGGDRPVHPSAWCKAAQGWVDVVNETENREITVDEVKSKFAIHRLWKDGDASSKEYFLLENRGLTGFDQFLPASGLLVWHIDDNVFGNTDENHPQVGLEQADGLEEMKTFSFGDGGDPFPGTSGNATFGTITNPNSRSYTGEDSFVSVTEIPTESTSMHIHITVKAQDLPPGDGPFNPRTWYRLTNTFQGHSLDVINDGAGNVDGLVQMSPTGNFSGQFWQIVPSGGADTFALRTLFLGAGRQLDVFGDDKLKPHLATAGFFSGQFWKILPWGDGTWHLENLFTGPDFFLDTMEGGPRVAMNQANVGRPTERWTITPIRDITEPGF